MAVRTGASISSCENEQTISDQAYRNVILIFLGLSLSILASSNNTYLLSLFLSCYFLLQMQKCFYIFVDVHLFESVGPDWLNSAS